MAFGQINPLNFVVARELAARQNVGSSTATRLALIGTLLGGEGIVGPIISRQLAIREAAPALSPPAATAPQSPTCEELLNQCNQIAKSLEYKLEAATNMCNQAQKDELYNIVSQLCNKLKTFKSI